MGCRCSYGHIIWKNITDPNDPKDLVNDLKYMGLVFENLCIRDLRVYADALDGSIYHCRDKTGLECDADHGKGTLCPEMYGASGCRRRGDQSHRPRTEGTAGGDEIKIVGKNVSFGHPTIP